MGYRQPDAREMKYAANRDILRGNEEEFNINEYLREQREKNARNNPQAATERQSPQAARKQYPWDRDGGNYRGGNEYIGAPTVKRSVYDSQPLWDPEPEFKMSDLTPRRAAAAAPSKSPPHSPRRGGDAAGYYGAGERENGYTPRRQWEPAPDFSPRKMSNQPQQPAGKNGLSSGGYDPSFYKPTSPRRGEENGVPGSPSRRDQQWAGSDLKDYQMMEQMFDRGFDPRDVRRAQVVESPNNNAQVLSVDKMKVRKLL